MDKIIFFTALALFPFGQLLKIGIFNMFDIAVVLLAIVTLFSRQKYPSWFKYFVYFVLFGLFSWILNYFIFNNTESVKGLMYLLRLFMYSFVGVYVFNTYKSEDSKILLKNNLLLISIASAIIGWVQYFLYPDLTSLKYFGWDDHLLRMVGAFLDPTFLGLVLILGTLLAIDQKKNKLLYFLIVSIAFTYSRVSFAILALILLYKRKYIALFIFALSIFLLPKMIGEGTNLSRTVSGYNKLINYKETIEIIKKSPVVGIGYNNMCLARQYYLSDVNNDSHSCSGSDSSILFLLATTGIVGTALFFGFVSKVTPAPLLVLSFGAVLIHSIFANSLFYPHIMFWVFALLGLEGKGKS